MNCPHDDFYHDDGSRIGFAKCARCDGEFALSYLLERWKIRIERDARGWRLTQEGDDLSRKTHSDGDATK